MSDTLIADADGVYHPGLFNDRMLLGMKGTMSEAELHILRVRLDGRIRKKAVRGELRRGLRSGWSGARPRVRSAAIPTRPLPVSSPRSSRGSPCAARCAGCGCAARPGADAAATDRLSARRRHRLGRADLSCGAQRAHPSRLCGRLCLRPDPSTTSHRAGRDGAAEPPQAGRKANGRCSSPITTRGSSTEHIPGQPNSVGANTRPKAHQPGTGAVREGCALLQGLATCGCAGASWPSTTTARPRPPPATTAPAPVSSSKSGARVTCASAEPGSTRRSPRRS